MMNPEDGPPDYDYENMAFDIAIDKARGQSGVMRFVGATISGILAGGLMAMAIQVGVIFNYTDENARGTWGVLYWGDHYVVRALWSIVATVWGAFIAGLIGRARGRVLGVVSAVPTVLLWLSGAFFWLNGIGYLGTPVDISFGNKVITFLIPAVSIVAAFIFGAIGADYSRDVSAHFDNKRYSLLGVKWYHYLWLPFLLHFIGMESAWAVDYGMTCWLAAWEEGPALLSIIPGLLFLGMLMTLVLTWRGISRAYDYISDYSRTYTKYETLKGVIGFGFGLPIASMILQGIISLIPYGLARLFS